MLLETYLRREFSRWFLLLLGLLAGLILAQRLTRYLAAAAAGSIPAPLLLKALALKFIALLPELLGICLFGAFLLAALRLAHDRELLICFSAGAMDCVLRAAWRAALPVALCAGVLSIYAAPRADAVWADLHAEVAGSVRVSRLAAGHFVALPGGGALYLVSVGSDGLSGRGVRLYLSPDEWLTADSVHLDAAGQARSVRLLHGRRYQYLPEAAFPWRISRFHEYRVHLQPQPVPAGGVDVETLPLRSLWQRGGPADLAEWNRRVSMPVMCLLLALLAVLLPSPLPGRRLWQPVLVGFGIYWLYRGLLSLSKPLLAGGLPIWLTLWGPHLLFLLLLCVLYRLRRGLPGPVSV